ncbi:MAG: hypothetical protein JO181_08250 [Solirubrobacterales bacterium]|nr:hypothetical protein [Solirubrobacterales bacterium]
MNRIIVTTAALVSLLAAGAAAARTPTETIATAATPTFLPAFAAAGPHVVPAKGKVAGKGYAYWLERSWQYTFSMPPPIHPCATLTVLGQRVALLTLNTLNPGADKLTCNEPAGRPLYVVELSNECSTFKGDHDHFGTSDSQLTRCARALFKGAKVTATVDGQSVDVHKLLAATEVYPVRVPRKNIFNSHKASGGRSAAYGYGLLLTGVSKGTHTIHNLWSIGTSKWDITFTVQAH